MRRWVRIREGFNDPVHAAAQRASGSNYKDRYSAADEVIKTSKFAH